MNRTFRGLEKAIRELPNIGKLKYYPKIWNEEVGDKIAAEFEQIAKIPMLASIYLWVKRTVTSPGRCFFEGLGM